VATATFTFDARLQTVWLDAPRDGNARAGELCERHARKLTPPQGWRLDDRRGALSNPAPAPVAVIAPAPAPALDLEAEPALDPDPEPAPEPVLVAADTHFHSQMDLPPIGLDRMLAARSPLLARAFESAGNR
jgi:hypothetical protein